MKFRPALVRHLKRNRLLQRMFYQITNFFPFGLYTNLYDDINWRIVVDFQTLNYCWSFKIQGICFKFHKALVTRYALQFYQKWMVPLKEESSLLRNYLP